ncbi:MAG: hypothetical protein K6B51_04460, partial [Bacilli bacterium]|nr:hypothetical protein [Bacilli bacterium]
TTKANPANNERANPINYVTMAKDATASYSFNVSTAGNAQIVAYVGNNQNSTAKKISDALECTIDGQPVSVTTASYKDSCMGNVNNRTNYYPVILGTSELTAGDHTIELKGKTSTSTDYLKLGTIALFGAAGSGSTGGNTGGNGGSTGGETTGHKMSEHVFTEGQKVVQTGYSDWTPAECSCGKKAIMIDALKYTGNGSTSSDAWANKDTSGATIKFNKNGNYCDYKINLPQAVQNAEVALYGWVDNWKDGRNNNDQKGFVVNGTANIAMSVGGNALTISNTETYEQMGMTAGENGNGSFTLCPVGATANLSEGDNTIRYERKGSYNLNITKIVFVY